MSDNSVYIDNQEALDNLSNHLEGFSKIAIDLEFDKNHYTYGFNICLIQLFDGAQCYLIDPLTIKSLASLFKVFEDPGVELITFAFGEDFRLLHHLGCSPTNIIDLSTVRSLLNRSQSSLTNVLIEELDIHSAKDLQRSNWCSRPLTEEQKIYAAEDVLFLFQLSEKLLQELSDLDRLSWLEDEKELVASSSGEVPPDFNSTYHKERMLMNLPQWERLKVLVAFREKHAEKLNKPTYKVVDRDLLSDLAMKNDLSSWSSQKRIHPALKNEAAMRELKLMLLATNREMAEKGITEYQPARPPMSQAEKSSHSRKKWLIRQLSEEVLIPIKNVITAEYGEQLATFILSKRMMEKLILGEMMLPNYRLVIIRNAARSIDIAEDKLNFLQ